MKFSIYDTSTGQILRTVQCDADSVVMQYDPATHSYLQGEYLDDKFYISGDTPVRIPEKPSSHHVFNYTTKQWEDPRTLDDLKSAQWALIKQARAQAEYAGFTWDGSTFDSDAISQNRITGAVTLAQLSSTFTIDWTLATNQVRTLNQSEMLQVGAALGAHVQTQFAKGQSLRVQIDAATTQAEVEAVVW